MLAKTQTPYALVKLSESARIIKQSINELPLIRKRLDRYKDNKPKAREVYTDLRQQHGRLIGALNTSSLALMEMELSDMAQYSVKLSRSIKGFNLMTPDYTKLCAAFNGYLTKLPIADTPEAKTTNAHIIGRLMNSVKMGYYPTDLEHVRHMARSIGFPEEAIDKLNRVGFGSYFCSSVSHEAFHLMLLNPPYLSVMTEGGNNTRSEKRFLVDSLYHLTYGGLLIYIIPYYRLTVDICRILCDNFDDLTVCKFMGDEFNVHELADQLNRSTSFSRLFEKNKLDGSHKRPLLPLNLGQVGLTGGSGLINGLVECDTPHIIKGRIVKENTVNAEENFNKKGELTSTTLVETRANKMIFNLLTPQEFLSLSDYATNSVRDGKNEDEEIDSTERKKAA